jgi:DNA-binding IclR family transcriptional regulator
MGNLLAKTATRTDGPMVLPRAFALLRLLAEEDSGLNLSAVATKLDVPKSSLSSTLKALTEQNFLSRKGSLYTLGPESYSLASVVLAGRSIRQIARPHLGAAMEDCGETVLLAVLDADQQHFTYIDLVESTKSVRYAVAVGTRRPLYATSCGRLFLAYQSEAQRKAYYGEVKLAPVTEKTVTTRKAMEELLADIREAGVSITLGDFSPDVAGFSTPIFNSEGKMIAALAIAMPVSRGIREEKRFRETAIRFAQSISKVFGYREDATVH